VKTWRNKKIREREALLKHHRQQWLKGLPKEESPSKMASEEGDEDSDDDDIGSRYDTMTFLAHLPDVRSLQGPIGEGSTSKASRAALVPVEGVEERAKGRAREGPSERGSTKPRVPPTTSVAPRTRARSPCTSSVGGPTMSTPEIEAPSSSVRTQG
jgi:hypothetical protein